MKNDHTIVNSARKGPVSTLPPVVQSGWWPAVVSKEIWFGGACGPPLTEEQHPDLSRHLRGIGKGGEDKAEL